MDQIDSVTLRTLQGLASALKKAEAIKSGEPPPPDDQQETSSLPSSIQRKEFQWDEVLKWLVAAIFGLTLLNVSADFFRNYTVTCYVPNSTSRDDVSYINNYCHSSLPRSEYFTLFIIIHGFLIIGPHVLWRTMFDANFHFFFDLVSNLDRLRESSSGEYSQKNFEIIARLEDEYTRPVVINLLKWQINLPSIYTFYLIKLIVQLLAVIGSIVFIEVFFDDFSEMFTCPTSSQQDSIISDPRRWPISHSVVCVYPSLRFLSLLRYGDLILLCLIAIVLIYALFWCILRHTEQLGHKSIATFCTHSNLPEDSYISCSILKSPFTPGIRTDLDFLTLMLFRASSGRGVTFKELQIIREMRRQYDRDGELLQLIINHNAQRAQRETDAEECFKQAGFRWSVKVDFRGSPRFQVESQAKPLLGLVNMERCPSKIEIKGIACDLHNAQSNKSDQHDQHVQHDQRDQFEEFFQLLFNKIGSQPDFPKKQAKYQQIDPPASTLKSVDYQYMLNQWSSGGRGTLRMLQLTLREQGYSELADKITSGEFSKTSASDKEVLSFQNRVYGFLQLVKPHRTDHHRLLAIDVSFDGLGCSFILAWVFKSVCVLNFHSHYRNDKEIVELHRLHNQVSIIRLPTNFYSLPANPNNNLDQCLDDVLFICPPNGDKRIDQRSGKDDSDDFYINFFTVGPITQDARRVTVNLLLEKFQNGMDIAHNCLMLTLRPLKIAGNDVTHKFLRYIPPSDLFKPIGSKKQESETTVVVVQEQESETPIVEEQESEIQIIEEQESERQVTEEQPKPKFIETVDDLRNAIGSSSFCTVNGEEGIICYCGDVECVIEMKVYRYVGERP